jgi:hypothetical protein
VEHYQEDIVPNFSTVLSKSIVGLTASALLIPVMSSSASAATLNLIGGVVGLARENDSDTQAGCTPSRNGWTVQLSCYQRYTAKIGLYASTAGRRSWRDIFQSFEFRGDRGKRYKIEYTLTGNLFTSAKAAGLAAADASSGLRTRSGSPSSYIFSTTAFARSSSDWESYYSVRSFEFNGGSTLRFLVGAQTWGFAEAVGLGFAEAKSNTSFTSIARITQIGGSRTSLLSPSSVASASSYGFLNASDENVASVADEDLINLPDDDVASVADEDLINLLDDDVANISDEDLINLPGDDVVASVPESSTVAGLALILTILLASKHSRFAKKHSKDAEDLVDTTAVEV